MKIINDLKTYLDNFTYLSRRFSLRARGARVTIDYDLWKYMRLVEEDVRPGGSIWFGLLRDYFEVRKESRASNRILPFTCKGLIGAINRANCLVLDSGLHFPTTISQIRRNPQFVEVRPMRWGGHNLETSIPAHCILLNELRQAISSDVSTWYNPNVSTPDAITYEGKEVILTFHAYKTELSSVKGGCSEALLINSSSSFLDIINLCIVDYYTSLSNQERIDFRKGEFTFAGVDTNVTAMLKRVFGSFGHIPGLSFPWCIGRLALSDRTSYGSTNYIPGVGASIMGTGVIYRRETPSYIITCSIENDLVPTVVDLSNV